MPENSILVAAVLFLVIAIFRKLKPSVWEHIPVPVRWLVPLLLAVVQEVAVALQTGADWRTAALSGILAGLMAMGIHTGVKALPGPYKG